MPHFPGPVPSRRFPAGRTDASRLRRLVHSVDQWSRQRSTSFVLVVWLGGVGSLIWSVGAMVAGSAGVYLALALLFLFGSVAIAALLYAMLLAPYVRTTDRGTSQRRAGLEFLVTAAEMVLSLMIGSVLDVGGGGSGAASGPALSGGGGSFGGGGATGSW